MALPAQVTFGTVVGKFTQAVVDGSDAGVAPDDVPFAGQLIFTPNVVGGRLLVTTAVPPATIVAKPVPVVLAPDGSFSVSLIATDNPALNPTGWTWTVSFALGVPVTPFSFALPAGTSVDLTTVAPVAVADGASLFINEAAASAVSAAASAASAATAASLVGAPADTAVAALVNNPASATRVGLSSTYLGVATSPVPFLAANADAQRGLSLTKVGRLLGPSGAGFQANKVESPCVFWDSASQRYAMTYTGISSGTIHEAIGLAWANSPLGPWVSTNAAILAGSGGAGDPDFDGATGSFVYIEGGVYHLFYIGLSASGYEAGAATKRLCLATATSLTGPWTRRGAVISPAGTTWRNTHIWHPSILKRADTYYCFFNATGNTGAEQIGYATAPALTGPWTVDDANSPLIAVGTAGAWDEMRIGDPSVYRVGDRWYMAYFGNPASDTLGSDGVASTTDALFPLGWTKHVANPVLAVGAPTTYDGLFACKPFILSTPDRHYHYYTADGSLGRGIGLAVSPGGRETVMVTCSSSTRSTASTIAATVTAADILLDTAGKPGLQARIHVRGNPGATATLTVSDQVRPSLAMTIVGNSWQNVSSPWVSLEDKTGLYYTNPQLKSSDGTSVSIAQVWYEFSWFSG